MREMWRNNGGDMRKALGKYVEDEMGGVMERRGTEERMTCEENQKTKGGRNE